MPETSIAVIGLGNMGLGMATTLAGKGFAVTGFDLSRERCRLAEAAGIKVAAGLTTLAIEATIFVLSLPLAKHVAETVEGGIMAHAASGRVIIDTSTSEVAVSRHLAALCAARGIGFLDAPVSGGPAGAKAGTLAIMIGGEVAHVEAARPVLDAMAAKVLHVGPSGAGNVAKLVNNLLVASHLLTMSEAMRLSEAAGVPTADVLRVINAASGRSAVSEINYPRWIESGAFDSGFTMGLMRKDVGLAAALAKEVGVNLPVSELTAGLWRDSRAELGDSEDFNRIAGLHRARHSQG
ncbi:MAG: NAD(P)-dependent oxidoreductase [Bosea sp. (in: a-proteobacteria)]